MPSPAAANFKQGLLWLAGGCAFTAIFFFVANAAGGGLYPVAKGAIVFGLLQMAYGVIQFVLAGFKFVANRQTHVAKAGNQFALDRRQVANPDRPATSNDTRKTNVKWQALVKFDDQISQAVQQVAPFGERWVDELRRSYFALEENKGYLPNIVAKLISEAKAEQDRKKADEAKREAENRYLWSKKFSVTYEGEVTSEEALAILRRAEVDGFRLSVQTDRTILATIETSTRYLRSNTQITRFGREQGYNSTSHVVRKKG